MNSEKEWLLLKKKSLGQLLLYAERKLVERREAEQYLRELKNNCQKVIWCLEALEGLLE